MNVNLHGISLIEHTLITTLVAVFHLLLLWIGICGTSRHRRPSNAERRLWRKFVGLLFVVLVIFANVALVIPKGSERAAALIAILLLAIIYFNWHHGTRKLERHEGDSDG